MKRLKSIYYNICSALPTQVVKKLSPAALFPYHHLVSDDDLLHIKHLYAYKNVKQFTADLDYLLKHLKPVDAVTVAESVASNKKLPRNCFLLSFDDGFREVHDVIAPILAQKGVPAIFFINPAFIDNKELFYRCKISLVIDAMLKQKNSPVILSECALILGVIETSIEKLVESARAINNKNKDLLDHLAAKLQVSFNDYLQKQRPFLTLEQTRKLADSGFTIGAHSWDHPYYKLLSLDEQQTQTADSMQYVRDNFNPGTNVFSFPHTDAPVTSRFFEKMVAGYPWIDLYFGTQNQKMELENKMIHRFNAERPDVPMYKQLNGVLMLQFMHRLLNKQNVTRKYA